MFTKFGAIYTSYIDLEHVGYDGSLPGDRWYPNERLIEVFDNALDIATVLEETGYDVFWLAEHYFQREGYGHIPNVPKLSVHLASQVKGIKLGCSFNIAPMWHPLRLA